MNKYQKAFNKVYLSLKKQGRPSIKKYDKSGTMICMYRLYDEKTNSTLKCAIGHLVPDENYDTVFEGKSSTTMLRESAIPDFLSDRFCGIFDKTRVFLLDLQNCHDGYVKWLYEKTTIRTIDNEKWFKDFSLRMFGLANKYGLDTSVMD